MATELGRVKPAAAGGKYDAFVASQLAKAESRIRLLDLTAALLGFAALSLAYIVGIVLCDSKLELSQHARQLALYTFLVGSVVYLFFMVVRPLRLRVNPYYAARQVEKLLPGAKNSIVNWVDLHGQPLPPAIRGALGQRAAKDLSHVDLDTAISGRRAGWMGGFAGLCVVAFVAAFFVLGPSPFYSLLQRAFNPFGLVAVSTRTQLTILKPEGGNATVTLGRGVGFIVEVTGKVPAPKDKDAVKLLYRYQDEEPWLSRLLLREPGGEWTTALSAEEVKNGVTYKVTGGDATTEEYRIGVRAAPAVIDFLATYHHRPYVARADEVRHERELKALRGTEVLMRVRTNRTLREGRIDFESKQGTKSVRGELAGDDPHVLLVRFVLNEDGKYSLFFTSTDSEAYSDPVSYAVTAIADNPPTVELTKPGQDIRLPADGLLNLEGKAGDDIGVASLVLRMRVAGGETLRGQPYRSGDRLRLADGGYPGELEYKDFVELVNVKSEDGRPFARRAGMELEYWLEASDACDYPRPNVTESKHYRVMLTEPEKNEKKAQQEKKQAEKDKKQNEDKQDQKLQKENRDREKDRKEQEDRNKEEQDKSKEADKGAGADPSQPKDDQKSEGKDDNGQPGEAKNQGDNGNELPQQQQEDENKIKDALDKDQNGQGESKPDKGDQGEGKGDKQNQPDGGNRAGDKSESEGKDAGQPGAKDTGEGKDKGQPQAGADPSQGDGKGEKENNPMPGDKGEAKGGKPMEQPGVGEAGEGKGKPDQAPKPYEGKPGGDERDSKAAGQGKPQPSGQEDAKGDGKPVDPKGQQAKGEASGESKDNGGAPTKSEAKGPGDAKDDAKAEVKQGGSAPMGDASAQGEPKPSTEESQGARASNGDAKPDADAPARKAAPKDVDDLIKSLENGNAGQRAEAKRQLEQIEKQALDPVAREKAEEALDPKGQSGGTGEAKPPQGEGDPKDRGNDGGRGESGTSKGTTPGSRTIEGGEKTGGGGTQRRDGDGDQRGTPDPQPVPNKPSKPRPHRATQMQLEDFLKKVDKNILKEAGLSEEAWKKYVESKRKQVAPVDKTQPETPAAPGQVKSLPSIGGRTIQPASSGPGNDVRAPDRGQPPPGYRDSVRKFNSRMSKNK